MNNLLTNQKRVLVFLLAALLWAAGLSGVLAAGEQPEIHVYYRDAKTGKEVEITSKQDLDELLPGGNPLDFGQAKLRESYTLLKEGDYGKKIQKRMLDSGRSQLKVVLVDDSNVGKDDKVWPHYSPGRDEIALGRSYYSNPTGILKNPRTLLSHEITHSLEDIAPWRGYGFPKGYRHSGMEIYNDGNPAFTEGIAIYYQMREGDVLNQWITDAVPIYNYCEDGKNVETTLLKKKSDLWKNEMTNAILLHDLGNKIGHDKIDQVFGRLNRDGVGSYEFDTPIEMFLFEIQEEYKDEDPDIWLPIAQVIENKIGLQEAGKVIPKRKYLEYLDSKLEGYGGIVGWFRKGFDWLKGKFTGDNHYQWLLAEKERVEAEIKKEEARLAEPSPRERLWRYSNLSKTVKKVPKVPGRIEESLGKGEARGNAVPADTINEVDATPGRVFGSGDNQ